MTRDPIGEEGGLNLYGAMGNSAVTLLDPWGLEPPSYPYKPPLPNWNPYTGMTQENVNTAQEFYHPWQFKDYVENYGPWDYKRLDRAHEDFGNYNYGATGAATGMFTLETLLREAGRAQCDAGTSKPDWGNPDTGPPYGDDPEDQYWIRQGWDDYWAGKYGTPSEPNTAAQSWFEKYSRCPECFDPWPY